jgi:hypothetical protein
MEEEMPYQTLVASIIHKYLIGRLQEQREQKVIFYGLDLLIFIVEKV